MIYLKIAIHRNWFSKELLCTRIEKRNDILANWKRNNLHAQNWIAKQSTSTRTESETIDIQRNCYKKTDNRANWNQNNWHPRDLIAKQLIFPRTESKTIDNRRNCYKKKESHELKPKQLVSTRFKCKSIDIHTNWIQNNSYPPSSRSGEVYRSFGQILRKKVNLALHVATISARCYR